MAQASNFAPQYIQEYPVNQQQSHFNSGFVVVNQQPSRREVFPYRLQTNWILAFGIAKCVLGSLILIVGIGQVAAVKYDTKIGIAIWCGLTVSSILAGSVVFLKCQSQGCADGGAWEASRSQYFQMCKKVGQKKLARLPRGLATVFSVTCFF